MNSDRSITVAIRQTGTVALFDAKMIQVAKERRNVIPQPIDGIIELPERVYRISSPAHSVTLPIFLIVVQK